MNCSLTTPATGHYPNLMPTNETIQKLFDEAAIGFDEVEDFRAKIFYRAESLFKLDGWKAEATLLLLATWNTAAFRYAIHFPLEEYEKELAAVVAELQPFTGRTLASLTEQDRKPIEDAFNRLRPFTGVGATGASKILHLINSDVFVMWDQYIRGDSIISDSVYKQIPFINKHDFRIYRYESTGSDYFDFLLACQQYLPFATYPNKTQTKQIDEFYYYHITKPVMAIGNRKEQEKKAAAKKKKADEKRRNRTHNNAQ